MTVNQCVERVDSLLPNAYDEMQKAEWVLEVERMLWATLYSSFSGQSPECPTEWPRDGAMELSASGAFEKLYVFYLTAMIHLANQDMEEYANYVQFYNKACEEYRAWYGRNRRQDTFYARVW